MQETRANQNTRGTRKEYKAGVGIIVHNSFMQHIEDIEPIDDRLMYVTLRGIMHTSIMITYTPPPDRPYEEKTEAY